MNRSLKNAIQYLYDNWCLDDDRKKILDKDFLYFIAYLSSADTEIHSYETDFLQEYFDIIINPIEMRELVYKDNINSSEFAQQIPKTLIELIDRDNYIYSQNLMSLAQYSFSKAYCEILDATAKEFIVCDGEATEAEITAMIDYISMINDYRVKNYNGDPNAKSGITISISDPDVLNIGNKQNDSSPDAENTDDDDSDIVRQLKNMESALIAKALESIEGSDIEADFLDNEMDDLSTEVHKNNAPRTELDSLLNELNGLVGLNAVKKDVNSLIHLQQINQLKKKRGIKIIPVSNHLVFYGNPGTGKTTVARLLAQIYHSMGILSKGQFVEVDRSGLVAGFSGQTAIKVKKVINSALGGVLFIDEAYSLIYSLDNDDFGHEAVDTLLKAMEDNREDLIVIIAGYPDLMKKLIDSNPGLRSRFNKYISFEDYNTDELIEIFKVMCENTGYSYTSEALDHVYGFFKERYENRGENFANAREVRNFLETSVLKQADRLFNVEDPSDEELCTLILDDVNW